MVLTVVIDESLYVMHDFSIPTMGCMSHACDIVIALEHGRGLGVEHERDSQQALKQQSVRSFLNSLWKPIIGMQCSIFCGSFR